jgi:hypothetical protein
MKGLVTALGIVMLGVAAGPVAGQSVRFEVVVNAPPVTARVAVGDPIFTWNGYPARGAWLTDARLARMHRQHMVWLAQQRVHFEAMRHHDQRYWQLVRKYERDRLKRERALEREYQRWLRDRERHGRRGRHR